jgi:hypothetical protein
MKKTLYPREWLAILTLLSFLLLLAKIAWQAPESRWPQNKGLPFPPPEHQIVLHISGALEQEGRYHFDRGTTLGKALEALSLNSEADISNLDLNRVLKSGDHVRIGRKKEKKRPQKKPLAKKRPCLISLYINVRDAFTSSDGNANPLCAIHH